MLFNSLDFAIFITIVFTIYWIIPTHKTRRQNILLLISSYVFYGWWDWRFLFLLFISSISDFFIGKQIEKTRYHKKKLLITSVILNLGLLGTFKYYNFFIDSFYRAFSLLGETPLNLRLDIILPVGISFYTFQTMSYTIDVYKKKIQATSDVVSFLAFVSFFPQLVAGPIERASNLIPQFIRPRKFHYANAILGSRQILWGFFKKMVIADNCAKYVNLIFENYQHYSALILLLGSFLFAFQIYGDFSGYSDIAIGVSRLFGFELMRNFKFPYFSRDISEFWRRWHISLSTWFRDYLYIPLGGSRINKIVSVRNTLLIFLISGFWHGANITFILWGLIHALLFLPILLLGKNRNNIHDIEPTNIYQAIITFVKITITFIIVSLAWVIFRSPNYSDAFNYYFRIFSFSEGLNTIWRFPMEQLYFIVFLTILLLFILVEWVNKKEEHGLSKVPNNPLLKWSTYLLIASTIFLFSGESSAFIYFQF